MKRQIRKNVFETNSSSVHAICIAKGKPDDYPGFVKFNHGEYGWESSVLSTVNERASYLYELICSFCYDDEKKKSEYLNKLYKVLGKHDIECDFDRNDYELWEWNGVIHKSPVGYIDHSDDAIEFFNTVMKSENRLLRFLFNDDSTIITGNDNIDKWETSVDQKVNELGINEKDYEIYWKGN